MITLLSENPLIYIDENGITLEIKEFVCPIHSGIIKYVEQNGVKIAVNIPEGEEYCEGRLNDD